VIAVASGKGGVGKSSVTVNLAMAMVRSGRKVGILDADIYGHSVPAMLGVADERPTQVEEMIMPVPALGLSVISIGMLKPRREQVVAWRGPMLDRALVQMLSDVYWGDLDVLLLDLPPGTGDMAISVGQHLPNSEVVVVTTPQAAASEVAERAGTMASMMNQRVRGVIENMSYLPCPHCGPSHRIELFGSGGGDTVAATLTARFGYDVPVLGRIPIDVPLREGGDVGRPIMLSDRDGVAATALAEVADALTASGRGLAGRQLGLTPAGR
jgi:ATP-binding protein involved in chromosome partitioning